MERWNSKTYNEDISILASEIQSLRGSVLVTGATGLIGTCIIDVLLKSNELREQKINIYALGRKRERYEMLFGEKCKEMIWVGQDICDELKIEKDIDYIIHTSSNADPVSYSKYPAETILTNVIGTKNVLDYVKKHGAARVLFTSTFEVYGKCNKDEYVEDDLGIIDFNSVRSGYPESKRIAELLCRSYMEEYDIDVVMVRLPSVYGPTMKEDDSKAHAEFIRNGIHGEDILLKSKGEQCRTYCYVMDTVSGIFKVLFDGKKGEVYNIANKDSVTTIADFAQTVAKVCGTSVISGLPSEIEKKGYSKPQNCILDTHKIEALGWKGKYSLLTGIKNTIDVLKEN